MLTGLTTTPVAIYIYIWQDESQIAARDGSQGQSGKTDQNI